MDNKVLNLMEGIMQIRLLGQNSEKIINLCITRGIYIWDIKLREGSLEFKIRRSAYEALANIVADHHYEMEVMNLQGMPWFKKVLRRRGGFFSGALLFILAIYLLSSFVWSIEVKNNQKIDTRTILLSAARHGLYEGAGKWSFKRLEVEEAMLVDINQLSYVKVDIKGVKVTIEVVEKILPGAEISGPCHIVAAREGVVEEILLLTGQAKVKEGDAVAKGDILISGLVSYQPNVMGEKAAETEMEIQTEKVRARGIVRARVWYEGYGECARTSKKTFYTGRENRLIMIRTPWRDIVVIGSQDPGYKQCSQRINKRVMQSPLGNFGWLDITVREKATVITHLEEHQAVKLAREKALHNLQDRMKSLKPPQDLKIEILSAPSDPILRCRVAIEMLEDIARAEPINEQ